MDHALKASETARAAQFMRNLAVSFLIFEEKEIKGGCRISEKKWENGLLSGSRR
jgi:hypothetical protein